MIKRWPYLVLIVMLSGALIGWRIVCGYSEDVLHDVFLAKAYEIRNHLNSHLQASGDSLYGAQGLFAANKDVNRGEWHSFVSVLLVGAGAKSIQCVRYVEHVPHEKLDAFIESVRHNEAFPAEERDRFYVFPVDRQDEYAIVKYVEPFRGNETMFGYNIYSDEKKKAVLERSRDTASIAVTQTMDLVTDPPRKGLFMTLPVYSTVDAPEFEEDRRRSLMGYVNIVLTLQEFIGHVAEASQIPEGIFFRLWDGSSSDEPFYDSGLRREAHVRFKHEMSIEVFDRHWTLCVYMTDEFQTDWAHRIYPYLILIAGIFISFLTFRLIITLQHSESQALSVVSDISQELSKKQTYLEHMIRSAPDPIVTLDIMGILKELNPAAEQLTGYRAEELAGRHFSQLGILTDKSLAKAIQEFALVVLGQDRPPFAMTIIKRNKELLEVEMHARRVDALERGAPQVQVIARDMTERKRAEEEIRQIKERLDLALRSARMGVWDWEAGQNRFVIDDLMAEFMGRAALARISTYEEFLESVNPEDRLPLEQSMQHALSRGEEVQAEFRVHHPDRSVRTVLFRGRVEPDGPGRARRVTGVAWDMTENKKIQSQLVQAQKMETIGVFSGGIAHDLNNQLSPVIGYLNLILKELGESHPSHGYVAEALQSATRCAEIVQRLMNYSRTSVKKKDVVRMQDLFAEMGRLLPKILPSTIQLSIRDVSDLPPVRGNENELETVLMNLAANARDAMQNGGKLSIDAVRVEEAKDPTDPAALPAGPFLCVKVSDTGQGIPAEVLPRIFEPFFTTKEKGKGTGLGLPMVFNIVKDHGGWIEVSSEVSKGTSFLIYLPIARNVAGQAIVGAKPRVSSAVLPTWSGTALFVDDEDYMRKLGKVFLGRLGFEVLLASDGEEAVEVFKAKHQKITFVMMDMTMPKQTGRATLKKILEIDPKAKVIVASGFTSEGQPEDLIREGAMEFLAKPYTIHSVSEILKRILPV